MEYDSGSSDLPEYLYTGKELDKSQLYYYGSRYYDPFLCRFIQPDKLVGELVFGENQVPTSVGEVDPFRYAVKNWNNWYAYCANNPVIYHDPTGKIVETVWDVVSLATGVTSLVGNVLSGNAVGVAVDGVGVVVDLIAIFLPGVPGGASAALQSGKVTSKVASKIDDVARLLLKNVDDAVKLVGKIDRYSDLTKQLRGTGLQAHHILEKRLAGRLGLTSRKMQSVALYPSQHQFFTNAWRKAIPYGTDYRALSVEKIWEAAQEVYDGYPELLNIARSTIFH